MQNAAYLHVTEHSMMEDGEKNLCSAKTQLIVVQGEPQGENARTSRKVAARNQKQHDYLCIVSIACCILRSTTSIAYCFCTLRIVVSVLQEPQGDLSFILLLTTTSTTTRVIE
jgi:hypothetical protein